MGPSTLTTPKYLDCRECTKKVASLFEEKALVGRAHALSGGSALVNITKVSMGCMLKAASSLSRAFACCL